MSKKFLSGNEAFAEGIRLAKPDVISAYPITPQTAPMYTFFRLFPLPLLLR